MELEVKKGATLSRSLSGVEVLPKGYKKTEIGVIPDDWSVVEFGELSCSGKFECLKVPVMVIAIQSRPTIGSKPGSSNLPKYHHKVTQEQCSTTDVSYNAFIYEQLLHVVK